MSEYISIRDEVLARLTEEMPTLRERFGVRQLRLFGSVSRSEDTPDSDIDLLYIFNPDSETYDNLFDLHEYLTELFGREVDLISEEWSHAGFLRIALRDAKTIQAAEGI